MLKGVIHLINFIVFIFLITIFIIIGIALFKILVKKRKVNVGYTPFDDVTQGKKNDKGD